MTEKVFNNRNYQTKDNSLIQYATPKSVNKGPLISRAHYLEDNEKLPIFFETEFFRNESGVITNEKGANFLIIPLDERNQAFFEFVEELDELGKGKTWENCKKWFGSQLELDLIDSWYKSDITPSSKGPNYLKLRLDLDNLFIKNQFGTLVDLHLINNAKIKVKLHYQGIAYFQQIFKPIFKIVEITYYQQNKVEDEDSFYTHENSYPTFKLNNLGNETDPEDNYEFEKNNEEDVRKLTKSEEIVEYEEESEDERPLEEVSVENEEEQEYEEVEKDEGEVLEEEKPLGDLFNVEHSSSNHTEENKEFEEILSKTLTKAINDNTFDESTMNLEYKDGDTLEDLKKKLYIYKNKVERIKTEKSMDSLTTESKGKTTKLILNNNKVKTVRHKPLE